ncbi:MAG: hypothetical protein JWQ88_960, partial [Rhodoferax sp.]|nr:hypothetical protein [Rhodoferax sp.]
PPTPAIAPPSSEPLLCHATGPAEWVMMALCATGVLMGLVQDPLMNAAGHVFQKVVWTAMVVVGLWRHRPRDRRLWLCVIAFFLITGVRNVYRFVEVLHWGAWQPATGSFLEFASAVLLSIPLALGSFIVMRCRRPRGDWAFADAWVMGVCALLVGMCLVTLPLLAQRGVDSVFLNLGVLGLLRNTLIIVPLLAICFSDVAQIRSFQVYLVGVLLAFASGQYFIAASLGGPLPAGIGKTLATLGVSVGQSLLAMAALLPSMREVTSPSTTPRPPWNRARALGMLVAVLLPVLAFVVGGPFGGTEQKVVMAGFGILLVSMVARLRLAVVVAARSEARLEQLANHDVLTGLPNRRYLQSVLAHRFEADVNRDGSVTLACCYIDLDKLKDVNDRSGHQAGDRLIQAVASALTQLPTNARPTAVRVGGDEFLVLSTLNPDDGDDGHDGDAKARQLAEDVAGAIQGTALQMPDGVEVNASIGSAWTVLSAKGQTVGSQLDHLIDRADLAQVQAKRSGGGRISLFEPALIVQARRQTSIHRHIGHAWELGQMSLVYQPVVNLVDGTVYGAESLLRWNHPELGWVSPPEAIQAAERQGWIDELGLRILDRALQDVARQPPDLRVRVGVNLSGEQLRPASVERIIERIAASGMSRWLWLEITEQALVENRSFVAASLEGLRSSGVVIAIDDFGTGYCGLDYLCTLPVDIVKLDGVFAREAAGSPTRRRVVQLGTQLAQAVGAVALAEGIEHPEVAAMMRDLGCVYGQGYSFSRPLADLSLITPKGFPAPAAPA